MIDEYQVSNKLLERLPIGLLVLNSDGNLKASNALALKLMNVAVEDLLLDRLDQVIENPVAANALRQIMAHSMEKSVFIAEMAERSLKWTVERATDSTAEVTIVIEDVSEFQRIDTVKREFLSTVLHRLRGPLSTLKTTLSLMRSSADKELPREIAELLDMSHHEANRLNVLLNDLRNLFYIDTGLVKKDLELEKCSIGLVLQKVTGELTRLPDPFAVAGVRLNITGALNACVYADFDKLKQALSACIKNAAVFSPPASLITICIKHSEKSVIIEIRDRGIGIAEDKTALLFTKFFREENEITRTHEGNGLGLYIAREFILLMNGTISIDTQQGQGTTVSIMLPSA